MNQDPEYSAALEWVVGSGNADRLCEAVTQRRKRKRRARRQWMTAAAVALAAVAVGSHYYSREMGARSGRAMVNGSLAIHPAAVSRPVVPGEAPPADVSMAVEVLVPRRETLPDGSVVSLDKNAVINVCFARGASGAREIELKSGEAEFKVVHDPTRAFVVIASGVEVTDVGTVFAVQDEPARVVVLVTEGEVRVRLPAARYTAAARSDPTFATVRAGQCLVVPLDAELASVGDEFTATSLSDSAIAQQLSWLIPRLRFSGATLKEAIPLFNRYSGTRIEIADPSLNELEISGVIRADDTDALLQLLQDQFGVMADKLDGETQLHR